MRVYKDRQWRKWFAWYPVKCGTTNHIRGTAWMETVEYRQIGADPYERPSILANYTYRFLNDEADALLPHRQDASDAEDMASDRRSWREALALAEKELAS